MRLAKLEGLREGLKKLGYIENINVEFAIVNAQGDREKLRETAQDLIDRQPSLIIAMGGVEADILKTLTVTQPIPVIFAGVALPLERGLIIDYQFPGGNLTGIDNLQSELAGKRLEYLSLLLPSVKRVLVIYDPQVPSGHLSITRVEKEAQKLGVEISLVPALRLEEIEETLDKVENRFDGIILLPSYNWETNPSIETLGLNRKIPIVGLYEPEMARGFLLSYGPSYYNQGLQTATMVAKVLRGQDPGKIPIETAYSLDFVINLDVAEKLNLDINPQALGLADRVIPKGGELHR
ncbi:MAG: ABC transporter substrate-binding protein [Desulfitobacterium hafniense]|nr:ABC transporter substrate-binding protein [Desulfitobacterium hafniense]MEA5024173.1 ABC transporter substrate-binding protein [Desulfitobacterium hafniense]